MLSHYSEEVDLFKLGSSPVIKEVEIYRRPIVQMITQHLGVSSETVGNWIGTLHWETAVANYENIVWNPIEIGDPDPNNALSPTLYGFLRDDYLSRVVFQVHSSEPMSPNPLGLGNSYLAGFVSDSYPFVGTFPMENGFYLSGSIGNDYYIFEIRDSTDTVCWRGTSVGGDLVQGFTVYMDARNGSTPSRVYLHISAIFVATRLLCNKHPVEDVRGNQWGTRPVGQQGQGGSIWGELRDDDPFTDAQKNYKFFIQFPVAEDFAAISGEKTSVPNSFGLWEPDIYYKPLDGYKPFLPNSWGDWSVWYSAEGSDSQIDATGRVPFLLRHAYPLWSILKILLREADPEIRFDEDNFSDFFGPSVRPDHSEPLTERQMNIFLTPSTNVLFGGYDEPAQKAKISLKRLLDALKKLFNVYWYIEGGNFHIEHKAYFEHGGTYGGSSPIVGLDLGTYFQTLVDKPWSFGQSEFSVDKDRLWSKIEYSWPENSSEVFDGHPLLMTGLLADPNLTDQRSIDLLMGDVDLMMSAPDSYSKDNFIVLNASYEPNKEKYYLPITSIVNWYDTIRHKPQNALMTLTYLNQFYHPYGLPTLNVEIEGASTVAESVARNKVQVAVWPSNGPQFFLTESQLKNLIQTPLGLGEIQDFSLNLLTGKINATLRMALE